MNSTSAQGSPVTGMAWIDGGQRPESPGVYRRDWPAGPFSLWDGRRWRGDAFTEEDATNATALSSHQSSGWRGAVLRFRPRPSAAPCPTCRGHGVLDRGTDDDAGWPALDECPDC